MLRVVGAMLLAVFAMNAKAELGVYQVEQNLTPIKVGDSARYKAMSDVIENLSMRIHLKRFTITKEDGQSKIKWEPICEIDSSVEVKDLRGGGFITEQLYGTCDTQVNGYNVRVVVSGFVYESEWSGFSDEAPSQQRNFMTHLQLQSLGDPIIFGLGDFNLGYTKELPFKHWVSELSTDAAGGRALLGADTLAKTRQGVVAAVRYGKFN